MFQLIDVMLTANIFIIPKFILIYMYMHFKDISLYFQLVDLHVYLVPPEIWREKFNNALNQNINDTVSLGFIR